MNDCYLLLGYGVGNKAIKKYLDVKNLKYLIYDDNIKEYKKDLNYNLFNIIIKSSGINDDHYILKYSKILNKEIITDLEFFYRFTKKKKIICITGSNGKTTTVSLVKHLIEDIDLGGNIGIPLGDFLESENDIIIEASSFMLEHISLFHANINVFTNIYPNHLEHHLSFKEYVKAKLKLLKNIKVDDYLIYNYDNILLRRCFNYIDVKKIPFSLSKINGLYLDKDNVYYHNELIYHLDGILLEGNHNLENILATIAVLIAYDKAIENLEKLKTFKTLNHRIEYIGRLNEIKVYNDSKSTNFLALKSSLETFKNENILLILGGKLKKDNFEVIKDNLEQIAFIIINGENKEILANYFKTKSINYLMTDNLISAITLLKQYLANISLILFSPASSSYDQFNNYEERGNFFKTKMQEIYGLNE